MLIVFINIAAKEQNKKQLANTLKAKFHVRYPSVMLLDPFCFCVWCVFCVLCTVRGKRGESFRMFEGVLRGRGEGFLNCVGGRLDENWIRWRRIHLFFLLFLGRSRLGRNGGRILEILGGDRRDRLDELSTWNCLIRRRHDSFRALTPRRHRYPSFFFLASWERVLGASCENKRRKKQECH